MDAAGPTGSAFTDDSDHSIIVTGTAGNIVNVHQQPERRRHLNPRTIAARLSSMEDVIEAAEELIQLEPGRAAEVLSMMDSARAVAIIPHLDRETLDATARWESGRNQLYNNAIEAGESIHACRDRSGDDLGAVTGPLEVVRQTRWGGEEGFRVRYENGAIYWSRDAGAFSVDHQIGRHYESLGGAGSRLGFPVDRDVGVGDGGSDRDRKPGRQQRFTGGLILSGEVTSGGVTIFGRGPDDPESAPNIARYFEETGGVTGPLGYPAGPRHDAATSPRKTRGTMQRFQGAWPYDQSITNHWEGEVGGAVVYRAWRGNAEPHRVAGGIGILHETEGGTGGWLGFPLTDEIRHEGEKCYQVFEGGAVYWTPQLHSLAVAFTAYVGDADEAASLIALGFPAGAADHLGDGDNTIQFFEYGLRTVRGGIAELWVPPRTNDR